MQVKIAAAAPAAPFNMAALACRLHRHRTQKSVFAATQHPPIVPQTAYNAAMNTTYRRTPTPRSRPTP